MGNYSESPIKNTLDKNKNSFLIVNKTWQKIDISSKREKSKILILLPFFTLGGAEKQALILAEFLNTKLDLEIEVWAIDRNGPLKQELIKKKSNIDYWMFLFQFFIINLKG